jgi:hypothetical protein
LISLSLPTQDTWGLTYDLRKGKHLNHPDLPDKSCDFPRVSLIFFLSSASPSSSSDHSPMIFCRSSNFFSFSCIKSSFFFFVIRGFFTFAGSAAGLAGLFGADVAGEAGVTAAAAGAEAEAGGRPRPRFGVAAGAAVAAAAAVGEAGVVLAAGAAAFGVALVFGVAGVIGFFEPAALGVGGVTFFVSLLGVGAGGLRAAAAGAAAFLAGSLKK